MAMDFTTAYRGTTNGSIQTTYTDQPGKAYNGLLMAAGEPSAVDSYIVGETLGVGAGIGVRLVAGNDGQNFMWPSLVAKLPEGDETENDFGGVVIFDQAMQTDSSGNNGWAVNKEARVLRNVRAGGRIWVSVVDAVDPLTDSVYWVIAADSAGTYNVGSFVPAALGGGTAGTTVLISSARWVTASGAGGVAGLELLGNPSQNFNSTSSL